MAAVCHAFVLRDFMCGILAEVGIGEFGEEVGDEIAVNRFIRVDEVVMSSSVVVYSCR